MVDIKRRENVRVKETRREFQSESESKFRGSKDCNPDDVGGEMKVKKAF